MDDRVSRPRDLAVLPDATSRRGRTGRDCRRVSPTLLLCCDCDVAQPLPLPITFPILLIHFIQVP